MVLSFLGFKLYLMFLDVLSVCNIAFEISSDLLRQIQHLRCTQISTLGEENTAQHSAV